MRKTEVYQRKYLILEKYGSSGEIKILPRDFFEYHDALKYLEAVNASLEEGNPTLHKKVSHYIVSADRVTFI